MAEGKIFHIQSRMGTGLVMDVEGECASPGTRVIMFGRKPHPSNNQLWYEHYPTGTIRSMLNDFCLDTSGHCLAITPFRHGASEQQWELDRSQGVIRNRYQRNHVLDIRGNNGMQGADICAFDFHGSPNQRWNFPAQSPRYFFIVSRMHGKVLDVKGDNSGAGAQIIMFDKKGGAPAANQLWYEGPRGFLRSKLNNFSLDTSDGVLRTRPVSEHSTSQHWMFENNYIVNGANRNSALDIAGENRGNSAKIIPYNLHGNANQQWDRHYV